MYLYHVLFTLINICGIDCQKKKKACSASRTAGLASYIRSHVLRAHDCLLHVHVWCTPYVTVFNINIVRQVLLVTDLIILKKKKILDSINLVEKGACGHTLVLIVKCLSDIRLAI
jgi:hypothetical protein